MNTNNKDKSQLTNEEADFIISKALKEEPQVQMSDKLFDQMWENAESSQTKTRTLRLRFYAVAATVALIVTLSGFWFYNESQERLAKQYAQSTMALNKVSKYLNIGLSKLEHMEEYNDAVEHLEVLEKPQKQVNKLKQINRIPIVIE